MCMLGLWTVGTDMISAASSISVFIGVIVLAVAAIGGAIALVFAYAMTDKFITQYRRTIKVKTLKPKK